MSQAALEPSAAQADAAARPSQDKIKQIVARHPQGRECLIPALQDIQQALGFLEPAAVAVLADHAGVSPNEIYGVATFYTQFRFTPPGKHKICSCQGTACHVRGGQRLLHEFEERLGIHAGQTTDDGLFELERVACVGCCALAPVVVVDDTVHANMDGKKVKSLISKLQKNK